MHKYTLPVNFDDKNPEFNVFKVHTSQEDIPNIKLFEYTNVRVSNNSVIFKYFNVFRESCISDEIYEYGKSYKFYLKYIFPKINFYRNKTFILITDQWTSNYYHWHLYSLLSLIYLKKNNLIKNSYFIIPQSHSNNSFTIKSLNNFGINNNQIIILRRKSNIKVKRLLFPKTNQNNPDEIKELNKILSKQTPNIINLGEKIYISRNKAISRYIKNEDEFLTTIKKYGFKKVYMEDYSYEEQISISANAKYIIGPHGAGLTNIIFMKKGSSLLELTAKSVSSSKPLTDYYKLSSFINLKYYYQECKIFGKKAESDFQVQGGLIVNCKKLKENLELMLNYNENIK